MPVFQYVARNEAGTDNSGALFASSEDALYQMLRQKGLFLLRSRVHQAGSMKADRIRLTPKQITAFAIHLSTSLDAGISLMDALYSLARESTNAKFQAVINGLITRISSGATFSNALSQYPRIFDAHFIQMVAVGEVSGELDERLQELVEHLEWQQEILSQVKQSSTYPVMIMALLSVVIVLMMTFTLPKFTKLLLQFNVPLPMPTRIVIAISDAFLNYWYLLPLLPGIPYAIYWALKRKPQGRLFLDRWKLKMPLFGSLQRKIALSRFAHHFSNLHAAGIDTQSALTVIEGLVGNLIIGGVISRLRQDVATGKSLNQQLSQSGEFPPFVVQMIAAGEESGNLEATLKKVSQYYDKEIPVSIKKAFTILEPVILVVMGGLVAFIALSILLPIYEFGTSVNK